MSNQKGIFISCLRATALIEKKNIAGLSFSEKFKLSLHTRMCKVCKAYITESNILDEGLNNLNKDAIPKDTAPLKDQIIKSLKK